MGTNACFKCQNPVVNSSQINVEPPGNQTSNFSTAQKPPVTQNSRLVQKRLTRKKTFNFDRSNFIHMKTKSLFDEYEIKEKLGEGGYGCVYKVQHKSTQLLRAVKAIKRKHVDSTAFSNEIGVLKTVDHPNIIKLFDCYYDSNYYYMVEEYCSGGDLYDYIRKQRYFSEKKAAHILHQLLSAVNHLHSKNIVHRDLKPENIVFIKTKNDPNNINLSNVISKNPKEKGKINGSLISHISKTSSSQHYNDKDEEIFIKLIDFGTSISMKGGNLTQELGTIYYIAPEVFRNNYNERADIWSIGIILYTMLCGHPPFCGNKEEAIKQKILHSKLQFLPKDFNKVSLEAINFVKQLLTYDPNKRPSAEAALENSWLINMAQPSADDRVLAENVLANLSRFTSAVTLQKATLSFIANQMTMNEDVRKLKHEFDKIDVNKDGVISREELIRCLETVCSHEEAVRRTKEIFEEIDFNNDGSINFSEFLTVNMKKEKITNEDMLIKAFKMFDLDGNGYITIDELKETLPIEIQNTSQWFDIVREVDQDGDCQISFDEFKLMMEKVAAM